MPTTAFQKSTSWALFAYLILSIWGVSAITVTFPAETYDPTTIKHPNPTGKVILVGGHTLFLNLQEKVLPPPECAFTCAGYNTDDYPDSKETCSGPEIGDDEGALVKCLCTDRPFLHHIMTCGMKSCGPAVNDALAFAYNLCWLHNVTLPAPLDLLKEVNMTQPAEIKLATSIENVTFSDALPDPAPGARRGLGRSWEEPPPFTTTTLAGFAPMATGMGMAGVAVGAMVGILLA